MLSLEVDVVYDVHDMSLAVFSIVTYWHWFAGL
jgi:hypothetical protein